MAYIHVDTWHSALTLYNMYMNSVYIILCSKARAPVAQLVRASHRSGGSKLKFSSM